MRYEQAIRGDSLSEEPELPPVLPPSERRRRSGPWKWVFLGCFSLLVLAMLGGGACVYLVVQAVSRDPREVEDVAREILPATIPAEFEGQFSVSILGVRAAFLRARGPVLLLLVSVPRGMMSGEDLRRAIENGLEGQGIRTPNPQETHQIEFRIRGKVVPVAKVELVTKEGDRVWQYCIPVAVRGRNVLVYFLAWDGALLSPEDIQAYLDSVH